MDLENASWHGQSRFYLPREDVRIVAAAYMNVSVTMTEMPFYTVDRINIPLDQSGPFQIGDHVSDKTGFISITPPSMQQVTTDGAIHYWCIDLFRGMASRLLKLDVSSLEVPYLPVGDFAWLAELGEELRHLKDDDARIEASNAALAAQIQTLGQPDEFEAALFHIYANRAAISAQELADHVGINRRKLERTFQARVGSSPLRELSMAKTFQTLENLVHGEHAPWHQQENTAFTDQSHFIRHTRNLTGTTPTALTGRYIWQTNEWYQSDMTEPPNSDTTYRAWHTHFRERINSLAVAASVPPEEISDAAPQPFRPTGPAPDYPLSPWTIM